MIPKSSSIFLRQLTVRPVAGGTVERLPFIRKLGFWGQRQAGPACAFVLGGVFVCQQERSIVVVLRQRDGLMHRVVKDILRLAGQIPEEQCWRGVGAWGHVKAHLLRVTYEWSLQVTR